MLVHSTLALDVQDIAPVQSLEVTDIDPVHLACAQAVGEHQLDHEIIPEADNGAAVDALQQIGALLPGQRMLVVFLGAERGLDSGSNVIAVMHLAAVFIEHFDDGDVAVDGEHRLALLLEGLLVVQDVRSGRIPWIDILGGKPAVPQQYLPAVIFSGGGERIQLLDPLVDDVV